MMNMDTIAKAYNNGYRTRDICCAIAAAIAVRYEEEDFLPILNDVYDNQVQVEDFSDITSINIKILVKMQELWDEEYFFTPRRRRVGENYKSKTTVFTYPPVDGTWTVKAIRPSRCAVTITSDGNMSIIKLSGVDPTIEQVAAMVTAAASKSLAVFSYDRHKRKFAFNIEEKTGPSGCCDLTLVLYEKVGSHYRRCRYGGDCLHISMAGKSCEFGMYLGDALEILNYYANNEDYRFAYYKMYADSERRLRDLGIRFSKPPKNMCNIIRDNVTFDPT